MAGHLAAQRPPVRGVIDGIVTDTSLVPLAGATLSLLGTNLSATTGENGRFRIVALPPGEYVMIARRLGFTSSSLNLTVDPGDTLRPSFALRRYTPELDTMRTSEPAAVPRIAEFQRRRALVVGGHFVTAAEIERRNPVSVAEVLAAIPGIEVGFNGRAGEEAVGSTRGGATILGLCAVQIFVDGFSISDIGSLKYAPKPDEIAGIEVYSGAASIPLQYKRASTCGVILIWTKSGD